MYIYIYIGRVLQDVNGQGKVSLDIPALSRFDPAVSSCDVAPSDGPDSKQPSTWARARSSE